MNTVPVHILIHSQFNVKFQGLKIFIGRISWYFFLFLLCKSFHDRRAEALQANFLKYPYPLRRFPKVFIVYLFFYLCLQNHLNNQLVVHFVHSAGSAVCLKWTLSAIAHCIFLITKNMFKNCCLSFK